LGGNKFRIFQTAPDNNNFGSVSMTVIIFIASLILKSERKKIINDVLSLKKKLSLFIEKCMNRMIHMA